MKLVRLATGEIVETNENVGTELTLEEITQLHNQEVAGIELNERRIEEYNALISNEQSKKILFLGVPDEISASNSRIRQLTTEQDTEQAQKLASQNNVILLQKYL